MKGTAIHTYVVPDVAKVLILLVEIGLGLSPGDGTNEKWTVDATLHRSSPIGPQVTSGRAASIKS